MVVVPTLPTPITTNHQLTCRRMRAEPWSTDAGAQPNDRGSQTGLPSRPAFRAKR